MKRVPKVLPEYLEQRRQQILDAAAACFSRRGFHQTTMQDICEESDLSPGAVYRYFRSKEEIIEGISGLRQQQNAGAIQAAMEKGNTIDALNELIRFFFIEVEPHMWQGTCALLLETITEAPRNETVRSILQRTNGEVRNHLIKLIRESQAKGEFNAALDPESIARVMMALYQGFVTQRLVDPDFNVLAYTEVMQALFGGDFWQGKLAPVQKEAQPAALRH
ncbi:MAG: TetR family transcriptional regulator [Dehalococcoidia bacterium]|nr:TetR family transcriptional regulator [Dehalococcoidia bacterium]